MELQKIGTGQIPDGYFGDWATVDFLYDPSTGKTLAKHAHGIFRYHTPTAINIEEAIWLLQKHPTSKARFLTIN